jgi:hypothetical protein
VTAVPATAADRDRVIDTFAGWQVVKELPAASTATVDVFVLRNDPVTARP